LWALCRNRNLKKNIPKGIGVFAFAAPTNQPPPDAYG
jgi:hypothetical protein